MGMLWGFNEMAVALVIALAATLQSRPHPMSLPWLILTFLLSRILSLLQLLQKDRMKQNLIRSLSY